MKTPTMATSFCSECISLPVTQSPAEPVLIVSERSGRLFSADCELSRLTRRFEWPRTSMTTEEVTVAIIQSPPCVFVDSDCPTPSRDAGTAGLGGHSQSRCVRSSSLCLCISCRLFKIGHIYHCETFPNFNEVESVGPEFLQICVGYPTRLPLPLYHVAYIAVFRALHVLHLADCRRFDGISLLGPPRSAGLTAD